jgi:hypothetical protein
MVNTQCNSCCLLHCKGLINLGFLVPQLNKQLQLLRLVIEISIRKRPCVM